jgi:hypothetical protein
MIHKVSVVRVCRSQKNLKQIICNNVVFLSPGRATMGRRVLTIQRSIMIPKINWDALGITTSILCAIHCTVLPLAVATLPVLGVNIVHNGLVEYGMIGLAFLIGSWALWHGFRHHHRRTGPLFLFVGGIILLIAKQVWHSYEFRLLPFAVLLILAAHILNWRWSGSGRPASSRTASQSGSGRGEEREAA